MYVEEDPIDGSIISADVNNLTIKPDASDQSLELSWQKFEIQQFVDMLEYYISFRSAQLEGASEDDARKIKTNLGEDYLRLAVLCDWYKLSDKVIQYGNLCLQNSPQLEKQVKAFLPSVEK